MPTPPLWHRDDYRPLPPEPSYNPGIRHHPGVTPPFAWAGGKPADK